MSAEEKKKKKEKEEEKEGAEKRRFIRHLLVNPLEFQVSEEEEPQKSETVNVSEGGLMFMSKRTSSPALS